MLERLKWMVAGEELRALERYRKACHLVWRWNASFFESSQTAKWIQEVGEDARGADIEQFRERIEKGEPKW